ncbi:hypothetical protein QBC33DRAFT_501438 [Phialemonium atrogriseum]|uniref:Uncharacterized protein n=1 Tax=Phialemonium atrogriseum TaxID=1093897 RepID=A0AAJ0FCP7_9PEZI|nr:uncharacterized protein QBC33DRAFT_501438 [Phialemonium atrogriseum]KAK1762327.1 hypothetical protein QBC33DRAFT_501438 [Phialemonium atrogriseum]
MSKHEEATRAALEAHGGVDEALPAYSAMPSEGQGPTADSPFNFPSAQPPPTFASASASSSAAASTSASASASAPTPTQLQRPIAIPQVTPAATAPFLDAYAKPLLQYGITPESWRGFLTTMSAFLAAKVSDQALAHAAAIGRHVSQVPKRFGQDTKDHAKAVGRGIRDSVRSGSVVGTAVGVIGGLVTLPLGTALRAVGAAASLPVAAVGAVTQKPRTPRERAEAYAAAANEKWFGVRGLCARLVDTPELARIGGVPVTRLLDVAGGCSDRSAEAQIGALNGYVTELETAKGAQLELGANTLWLMIFQEGSAPASEGKTMGGYNS